MSEKNEDGDFEGLIGLFGEGGYSEEIKSGLAEEYGDLII